MSRLRNPFETLYVTETVPPDRFVDLFAPTLLDAASSIFRPGHVVVLGLPGSGKTTLLSLLRTQIRAAYHRKGAQFPVAAEHRRFIACGVNLKLSNAATFGQRRFPGPPNEDALPAFFGDYLNWCVLRDLLETVEFVARSENIAVRHEMGVDVDGDRLDAVGDAIASAPGWLGYLPRSTSFAAVRARVDERLRAYFDFLNFNTPDLPDELSATKTLAGEPLAQTAQRLAENAFLEAGALMIVQIDQCEELDLLPQSKDGGVPLRRIVNRMLWSRDGSVQYRIGTRKWSWNSELGVYGSDQTLERNRDYHELDLDAVVQSKEHSPAKLFKDLAREIVSRRLRAAGASEPLLGAPEPIRYLLGDGESEDIASRRMARQLKDVAELVKLTGSAKTPWGEALRDFARENPYEARLVDAAVGQRTPRLPSGESSPAAAWDLLRQPENQWWLKERRHLALMQVARAARQRIRLSGAHALYDVSAGNVLAMMALLRHVWAGWEQRPEARRAETPQLPFDVQVQGVGFEGVSWTWLEKMVEQVEGGIRRRFLHSLAIRLRARLLDPRMSYPGHTGISVADDEWLHPKYTVTKRWLDQATDFGDLVCLPHTSKERDQRARTKWYVPKILCPALGLPTTRTKEPWYVSAEDVTQWLDEACTGSEPTLVGVVTDDQLGLPF